MAVGDEPTRPARRSRIVAGEPGTAPIAYLFADREVLGDDPREVPGDDPGVSGAGLDGAASKRGASEGAASGRASRRGAHPAGTQRDEATGSGRGERRAANVSMSALTRRGMSRWELERTLLAREIDPEIVAAELDRLEGVGLLDDAALAETVVRTQHERKGLGRSALAAELRRKHIDQDTIDAALEQVDDDDEAARALELAERRARQLTSLDRDTAVRRLTGYLMRKGYSSSVVRDAVDAALPQRGSGGVRFR